MNLVWFSLKMLIRLKCWSSYSFLSFKISGWTISKHSFILYVAFRFEKYNKVSVMYYSESISVHRVSLSFSLSLWCKRYLNSISFACRYADIWKCYFEYICLKGMQLNFSYKNILSYECFKATTSLKYRSISPLPQRNIRFIS